ncbi:flagellar export chaperone FlgN [Tepidibacter thalassicus]|uniref:FlgN protein n=1 Tax=Tepidibacter thalassicus DSM 15285 TaxID=1123350 RepID=A0A1M5R0X3_9FIRM|nr:flagellar export chaperone FlgN [Tepidibacter thalassicus]SHH20054.1 FlgN protein [Tepidibacter thalassicus DSM 15285]
MNPIDQFIAILSEELTINKKLLEISTQKKDVIINNDTKKLNQMVVQEQNSIKRIIHLEKLRGAVVSNIQKELGIEKIDNIKDIVNKIDENKASEIENIALNLKSVLKELEEKNNLNNKLLEVSLEYLELNLNLLTSRPEPKTYGKKAVEYNSRGTGFFDAKY